MVFKKETICWWIIKDVCFTYEWPMTFFNPKYCRPIFQSIFVCIWFNFKYKTCSNLPKTSDDRLRPSSVVFISRYIHLCKLVKYPYWLKYPSAMLASDKKRMAYLELPTSKNHISFLVSLYWNIRKIYSRSVWIQYCVIPVRSAVLFPFEKLYLLWELSMSCSMIILCRGKFETRNDITSWVVGLLLFISINGILSCSDSLVELYTVWSFDRHPLQHVFTGDSSDRNEGITSWYITKTKIATQIIVVVTFNWITQDCLDRLYSDLTHSLLHYGIMGYTFVSIYLYGSRKKAIGLTEL